jgi:hypothetical protein
MYKITSVAVFIISYNKPSTTEDAHMNSLQLQPGPDLYNKVRGSFISNGASLGKWCRENGSSIQAAKSCLTGTWNGPKGRELRQRLIEASGVADSVRSAA